MDVIIVMSWYLDGSARPDLDVFFSHENEQLASWLASLVPTGKEIRVIGVDTHEFDVKKIYPGSVQTEGA